MADFGERLRAAREASGRTQTEAARIYGVAAPTWSAWELGSRVPSPERQSAILASLEAPPLGRPGDYRDGAIWALSLMHETLARAYRELAAGPPRTPEEADDAAADEDAASSPADAARAPASRPRSRRGAAPDRP